jgi:hypothetical protein
MRIEEVGESREREEEKDEHSSESAWWEPARWFFGFDGWRSQAGEDEFVLA